MASTFYSLIETAKLNGLNPAESLVDALRAAKRNEFLLPMKTT